MARATITVMFTDLVGSTAMMSEVGQDAAEELRREHFSMLRSAVGASGGLEVKNLGDGLMVVFPSAADALQAGVEVQRAFARRNRRAAHPLVVRVGVAVGDADVEDGDYFGLPVVQAARLCSACEGGEVWCTAAVQLLGGGRGDVGFEPLGELTLKGLDTPVAAVRVTSIDDPDDDPAVLPARLTMAVNDRFVGRELELQTLHDAWKEACEERARRVALISGEPGIGKTTLTARLAAQLREQGALVLYGRCDEDLGVPYQPWVEALTQLVDQAPIDVLRRHVDDRGASLARWAPQLSQRSGVDAPSDAGDDSDRAVLVASVIDLLERVSAEQPLLMVVDDLHWADRQSVLLLRQVIATTRPLRLLVAGTFRDSDISADHPMTDLLAVAHRERGVTRIALRGLGDAELLALLERTAGHDMDDAGLALRDAVLAETSGNPFFVGEILRHLAETGVIYANEDGRWVGDIDIRAVGLPVSVREVVGRRVAALGADVERLLGQASVIGRDFDLSLLATVSGIDEDAVIDHCDAAVAASVLRTTADPNVYTFAHALIERTLYDGLSPARRARLHRSVAEAIETTSGTSLDERAAELAHHWSAAVQPTDMVKSIKYAEMAGQQALVQLAPHDALGWYQRALDQLPAAPNLGPADRARLLVGLGVAQRQCGLADHRTTLLAAADLADDVDEIDVLVDAALANSRNWQSDAGNLDHDRLRVLHRALDRVGPGDLGRRAELLSLTVLEQTFSMPLERRLALCSEAVTLARQSNHPPTLARVLSRAIGATFGHPASYDARRAWDAEVRSVRTSAASAVIDIQNAVTDFSDGVERADQERFDRGLADHATLLERTSDMYYRWQYSYNLVTSIIVRGDLAEAESAAEAALSIGLECGQPDAFTIYGSQLLNIRHHQGRIHELIDLVEEARQASPLLTVYGSVLAMASAFTGDHRRANELIDAAARDGFDGQEDQTWATALACWTNAVTTVGRADVAARLHELLRPYPDFMVSTGTLVLPSIAYYLGLLDHLRGNLDDAEQWFARAEAVHSGLVSPLLRTYVDAGLAAVLADRGHSDDIERARTLAERALDTALTGGYGYLEADARDVLARV